MPAIRMSMRQIREVLRQKWGLGLSNRQTARGCGISRPTVADYLRRANAAYCPIPYDARLLQEFVPATRNRTSFDQFSYVDRNYHVVCTIGLTASSGISGCLSGPDASLHRDLCQAFDGQRHGGSAQIDRRTVAVR